MVAPIDLASSFIIYHLKISQIPYSTKPLCYATTKGQQISHGPKSGEVSRVECLYARRLLENGHVTVYISKTDAAKVRYQLQKLHRERLQVSNEYLELKCNSEIEKIRRTDGGENTSEYFSCTKPFLINPEALLTSSSQHLFSSFNGNIEF